MITLWHHASQSASASMHLSFETYEDFAFNVNGLLFLQIRSAVCAQKLSLKLYALKILK